MPIYQPPCPISEKHNLDAFDCGEISLNDWLKRRVRGNEQMGASRAYVVCDNLANVVGFFTLSNSAVMLKDAPKILTRNMPDPIPVMLLGRLAVDIKHQGKGLGSGMLRDAVSRVLRAGEIGGIRAILVHVISERAMNFYERNGFLKCPFNPMMFMLPIKPVNKNQ